MKKPWWSDHLTILWNDVCAIEKEMLKSKSDTRKRQCRQEFICKRKLFDRETQRSKRRYWRDQLNEIDNLESTNQTEFWKKIGRVGVGEERRKAIPMSVQLPDGSISHDRDAVLNEWKRSFCSLLNPEGSIDNLPTDTSTDNGATMNYDITHEEVKQAVISLKVNKAVGVDEIPSEVLKNPCLLNFLLSDSMKGERSMKELDGIQFSTYDRDNDQYRRGICTKLLRSGWWHNYCTDANLNGQYYAGVNHTNPYDPIYWWTWHPDFLPLKSVTMKIKSR
ncbi:Hypothetical predicted protein [Mytilus galloprovincialis]|uniref:Fibrinogen C-terminal domain-containing protein n=1 Tax=Mytilus galloprovincialis TaxID=29158 RepID=A0A8B6G8S6_MYTGA|nr:Hypothetical predicted protein [Mytilus galloprovincialis]